MAISLTAAMRQNLFSLQNTNTLMELTQSRLATGKRVQSALDDPINFFSAREHTQRADDLSFRKDAMSEAVQTIKAANNGIEAIQTLIASAKSTAQSALSLDVADTTGRASLATQFDSLRAQITNLADDSGYKGINFLESGGLTVSFDAAGDNTIRLEGFDACAGASSSTGLGIQSVCSGSAAWGTSTVAGVAAAKMTASIAELDDAKDTLRSESQKLSNNLSIITARQNFTDSMINTLNDGATSLVNADMNEEGANMLMLQTRQGLGTTSLSMASQAAQSVMRLF